VLLGPAGVVAELGSAARPGESVAMPHTAGSEAALQQGFAELSPEHQARVCSLHAFNLTSGYPMHSVVHLVCIRFIVAHFKAPTSHITLNGTNVDKTFIPACCACTAGTWQGAAHQAPELWQGGPHGELCPMH
jgi:hypothetical protein